MDACLHRSPAGAAAKQRPLSARSGRRGAAALLRASISRLAPRAAFVSVSLRDVTPRGSVAGILNFHSAYFICMNPPRKSLGRENKSEEELLSVPVNAEAASLLNQEELLLLPLGDCNCLPFSPCLFWSAATNSPDSVKQQQRGVCQSSGPKLNYSHL